MITVLQPGQPVRVVVDGREREGVVARVGAMLVIVRFDSAPWAQSFWPKDVRAR